jgi:hypothetical protein
MTCGHHPSQVRFNLVSYTVPEEVPCGVAHVGGGRDAVIDTQRVIYQLIAQSVVINGEAKSGGMGEGSAQAIRCDNHILRHNVGIFSRGAAMVIVHLFPDRYSRISADAFATAAVDPDCYSGQ